MKMFKILHLPTAKYVWEQTYPIYTDFLVDNTKETYSIFTCRDKNIMTQYLARQLALHIRESNVYLYPHSISSNDGLAAKLHEFEIIEVEDV